MSDRRSYTSGASGQGFVKRVFAADIDERETGFSEVVATFSRRGLLIAGALGVVVMLVYLFMHIVVMGYEPAWAYDLAEPNRFVMWDKLLYLTLSLVGLVASRTNIVVTHGRLILGSLVFLASLAMLFDDVASGRQSSYSIGYLTIAMFLAVGSMPFRPTHIFLMSAGIFLAMVFGPALVGFDDLDPSTLSRHITYWVVASVLLVGISSLVYRSRFDQYMTQHAIEEAERRVVEYARSLEAKTVQLAEAMETTEEQAAELRKLERLKSRFFAGISHEFRTPITLILGPAQTELEEHGDELPSSTRSSLGLIRRSGHRLMELVDQLLDLSRLEDGRMPMHVAGYDLSSFVRRVVGTFRAVAEARKIELELVIELDDEEVYFDQEHLEKVLDNLLSNAFKFTPGGGRIKVAAAEGSDEDGTRSVSISVKDNGEGIPKDQLDAIFDRFHQVDGLHVRATKGTGIGLALVKELVELHHGSVRVDSELGFGSEFTIAIPRGKTHFRTEDFAEEGYAPPPSGPHEADSDGGATPSDSGSLVEGRPTVLVVDDHPDMLEYVSAILGDSYNVVTAADGKEGFERAKEIRPDLVISDVMMPVMDGYELCARVKEDEELGHIPVVMLTAKATIESKLEALHGGADDYILKPFDANEVVARVENLIEIRRMLAARGGGGFTLEPSEIDEPSADEVFLETVSSVVEENLRDGGFTIDRLADEVGLSRRQLERKLRSLTRLTPHGYVRMMRLKRAAQLLEKRVGNVSEVAYRVGFSDPNYFSRLFRQTFGSTPSDYIKEGSEEADDE
jgi:signal transduction histidine kinase/DNA-binding response OmpR family regulator